MKLKITLYTILFTFSFASSACDANLYQKPGSTFFGSGYSVNLSNITYDQLAEEIVISKYKFSYQSESDLQDSQFDTVLEVNETKYCQLRNDCLYASNNDISLRIDLKNEKAFLYEKDANSYTSTAYTGKLNCL